MRRPRPPARVVARTMFLARSANRIERARQMSAEGLTKEDAADHLGMHLEAFNAMLRDHLGSKKWPIT